MTLRTLLLAASLLVVFFTLRRRIRNFGRQPMLRPRRMVVSIAAMVVVGTGVLLAVRHDPNALASSAGGLAIGAGLAVVGLRLTRFESSPEGLFFTPNKYLGAVLIAAVISRLSYRFAVVGARQNSTALAAFQNNSITLFLITVLIGYTAAYLIGLLRTVRKHDRT
jgi:uncharacterized membrane protein